MAGPSRMDRFIGMLGGDENLPPQIAPQAPPAAIDEQPDAVKDNAPIQPQGAVEWWNAPVGVRCSPPAAPVASPPQNGVTAASAPPPAFPHPPGANSHYDFGPRLGEPAPLGINFSPFRAVVQYCYKFVSQELRQPLATAFFDANKIYTRGWHLYYVWSEYCPAAKPTLFIPEYQLTALLNDINAKFPEARLEITPSLREEGVLINFDDCDHPDIRPRVLGYSNSREQIEYWATSLPFPESVTLGEISDRSLKAFRAHIELALDCAKKKKNGRSKGNRNLQPNVKRLDLHRMIDRTQRYLGLRPASQSAPDIPDISKLSLNSIETAHIVPYPFDQDAIFIAFDVEAYEHPPRPITEIGIAVLDTRDLKNAAPGPAGEQWRSAIRARHILIEEYKNLINSDFVQGCPANFEFGKSETIGMDVIQTNIAACFKHPFSGPEDAPNEPRNVVLVGHDIDQDIDYLRALGYNPGNLGALDTLDTAEMFRIYTKDPNVPSLGSMIYEFGIPGWHLHNAGNDAVYTLWGMLAMCVTRASEAEEKKEEVVVVAEPAKESMERLEDDGSDGDVKIGCDGKPEFGPPGVLERQYYTSGGAFLDI